MAFDGYYPALMSPGAPAGHTTLTGRVFFMSGCDTGARDHRSVLKALSGSPEGTAKREELMRATDLPERTFDRYRRELEDGGYIETVEVGSSRVDLQACKLEYSIVSPK